MTDKDFPYADILHLPHHRAAGRAHMSLHDRAAQFAPFAALTGFDGVIAETGRQTERRIELSERRCWIANSRASLKVFSRDSIRRSRWSISRRTCARMAARTGSVRER